MTRSTEITIIIMIFITIIIITITIYYSCSILFAGYDCSSSLSIRLKTEAKGAFTRQSKNGTDPTKTGTVPIVFAKKQGSFIRCVSGP